MSLFSNRVETAQKPITEKPKERRKPPEFRRDKRKRNISDSIKNDSLKLLKEMLSKQKEDVDQAHAISSAGAFANQLHLQQLSTNAATSLKIDPSIQLSQLFEKLIRSLKRIDKSGISETSIILGKEFSSSIFSGVKITITEYSTAPKIFNIQLNMTPQALSFYEGHASSLLAALKNGKFGFDVGRIDTALLQEEEEMQHLVKAIEQEKDLEDHT